MFNIFFSANVSLDIFKEKDKLKEIKVSEDYKLSSITFDCKEDKLFIFIFGKSLLYERRLKIVLNNNKTLDIEVIKNKIEERINKEIKDVNEDMDFVNMFSLLLSKMKEKSLKELMNSFDNDLKRFKNIMEETYKNTYKLTNGVYETIFWEKIMK